MGQFVNEAKRVLASAIADGKEGALDRAKRSIPWILRGRIARKIQHAKDAIVLDHTGNPTDEIQLYRLAWLELAEQVVPDTNDHAAVFSLYQRLNPQVSKQSFWIRQANAIVLVSMLAIAIIPVAWQVFGEVPPLETPEGNALGSLLPDYVIAVNNWADAKRHDRIVQVADLRNKVDTSRDALLAPDVLPPPLRTALTELLDATEQLLIAPDYLEQDPFQEKLRGVNRALLDHNLPYYIDAEIIDQSDNHRLVILSTYYVLEKRMAKADDKSVLALHVSRLDNLNFRQDYLGFTRPHIEVALVLHDNLEDVFVNFVAPALGEGRPMPLLDMESRDFDEPWQDELLLRAGETVRSELHFPDDADPVSELGRLFADRYELVRRWQVELERKKIHLPDPKSYHVTEAWQESVEPILPNMELVKLRDIERALDDETLKQTFAKVMAPLVESVERHEVQHRVDYEYKKDGFVPAAVRTLYGLEDPDDIPSANAKRVATELSAYVAELAYDGRTTYLNLTLLSRLLFQKTMWGTAESQVALILFQDLPQRVGLEAPGRLTYRGRVDREKLAEIYLGLLKVDRNKIREAARALWEEQYGRPLPKQITSTVQAD